MRYTVILEPTREPDHPGWYYAHVPTLDLTTHGLGIEGALEQAREMVTVWIEAMRARGEAIPESDQDFVTQIEISEDALSAA